MTNDQALVLIIGNKNLSSWSLRPWIVLRHAGIPFTEKLLPFETAGWRTTIEALSPSRRVPALHHGSLVIWDSLAICEYVADCFPDRHLWPADRAVRAVARAMSAEMHSGFGSMRNELSMDVTARLPQTKTSLETDRDVSRVLDLWRQARRRVDAADGPFLFGAFGIVDAMFAPVAYRLRTYGVPIADPDARAYCNTLLELPAMKEWEADAAAEVAALSATARAPDATPNRTPHPDSAQHCFAVIFSSRHTLATVEDDAEYQRESAAMEELAAKQPGFLGMESARNRDGFGITVSYWESLQAIKSWKDVPAHVTMQRRGQTSFYERYEVRVASVERGYRFPS